MSCDYKLPNWYDVHYGTPHPRYIRPLVRINAMTEDAPFGYKLHPCFLPKTIVVIDNCAQTIQVNDTKVSYADMFPCLKLPSGSGVPVNAPQDGYYPFYLDVATKDFYAFVSGTWYKTN